MRRILIILAVALSCGVVNAQEYRDVVFLKNGSVIKGFYKELYPSDSLRMETIDGGVLVCAFSDIKRIAKERTRIYVVNTQEVDLLPPRVWRPKGYNGSIEYGRDINSSDSHLVTSAMFTVHGYQFNPYFFIGLGLGVQHMEYETSGLKLSFTESTVPLFADMKIHLLMRFNMIFNERAAIVHNFSSRYFAGVTLAMNNSVFDDDVVVVNQNKWRA